MRILATLMVLLITLYGHADVTCAPAAGGSRDAIEQVIQSEGWAIPVVPETKNSPVRSRYNFPGKTRDVFVTIFEPSKPIFVDLQMARAEKGCVVLRKQPIKIIALWRFEIEGKVYAYGIHGAWVSSKTPSSTTFGRVSDWVYYDMDGDGLFETLRMQPWPFIPLEPAGPNRAVAGWPLDKR
jgi:hypothetical protein